MNILITPWRVCGALWKHLNENLAKRKNPSLPLSSTQNMPYLMYPCQKFHGQLSGHRYNKQCTMPTFWSHRALTLPAPLFVRIRDKGSTAKKEWSLGVRKEGIERTWTPPHTNFGGYLARKMIASNSDYVVLKKSVWEECLLSRSMLGKKNMHIIQNEAISILFLFWGTLWRKQDVLPVAISVTFLSDACEYAG